MKDTTGWSPVEARKSFLSGFVVAILNLSRTVAFPRKLRKDSQNFFSQKIIPFIPTVAKATLFILPSFKREIFTVL